MQVLKGYGYNVTVWGVAFSPDGRELASVGADGAVLWWDLTSGTSRQVERRSGYMPALAVSPDGRWLARTCWRTVLLFDREGGESRALACGETGHLGTPRFSPDGRVLAAPCRRLFRWNTDTWALLSSGWLGPEEGCTMRIWDVNSWTEQEAYNWEVGPLVSLAIAPDGMRAAAGSKKGRIIVWDLDL